MHCKPNLSNGESVLRPWLIYSVSADKIYCFYCRLLEKQKSSFLNEGFDQWQSCTTRLAEHEKSQRHLDAMTSCCEAGARLSKKKKKQALTKFTRRCFILKLNVGLVAIVRFLAKRNLAFRGTIERLKEPSNGNFLV